MNEEERNDLFRSALGAYHSGRFSEAAARFRHLVDDGSSNPEHLSFCGLLMARAPRTQTEGLELCERALSLAFYDPQMYLNLARFHSQTGRQNEAVEVLRRGLHVEPNHRGLLREIQRLSPRRKVFNRLDRDHFLNYYLGKFRGWLQRKNGTASHPFPRDHRRPSRSWRRTFPRLSR